jgi:hypothetical protein
MTSAGIIATPVGGSGSASARTYFSAQSLPEKQNVDEGNWTNQVTLTATLTGDFVVFWSCECTIDTQNVSEPHVEVRLKAGVTTIDTISETGVGGDGWFAEQGMHFITGAGAVTITLDFRRTDDTLSPTAKCRNGRIFALKLESGDKKAESLPFQSDTVISFTDALTLSFTPDTAGSYLILAFAHLTGSLSFVAYSRIYDGSNGTPDVGCSRRVAGMDRPSCRDGRGAAFPASSPSSCSTVPARQVSRRA